MPTQLQWIFRPWTRLHWLGRFAGHVVAWAIFFWQRRYIGEDTYDPDGWPLAFFTPIDLLIDVAVWLVIIWSTAATVDRIIDCPPRFRVTLVGLVMLSAIAAIEGGLWYAESLLRQNFWSRSVPKCAMLKFRGRNWWIDYGLFTSERSFYSLTRLIMMLATACAAYMLFKLVVDGISRLARPSRQMFPADQSATLVAKRKTEPPFFVIAELVSLAAILYLSIEIIPAVH